MAQPAKRSEAEARRTARVRMAGNSWNQGVGTLRVRLLHGLQVYGKAQVGGRTHSHVLALASEQPQEGSAQRMLPHAPASDGESQTAVLAPMFQVQVSCDAHVTRRVLVLSTQVPVGPVISSSVRVEHAAIIGNDKNTRERATRREGGMAPFR